MSKPLHSISLTTSIAVSVAAGFYAVSVTATSDPFVRPYAAAFAAAFLAALVIHGLVDLRHAQKGLLVSVFSVLPNIYRWGSISGRRAAFLSALALSTGFVMIWLGPLGIRSVSITCDAAATVGISARPERFACDSAIAKNIWLTPFQRYGELQLVCFDKRENPWNGIFADEDTARCNARPLDARYVKNGIPKPDYDPETVSGRRMKQGLDRLSDALSDGRLPDRRTKDRLLFATWNIRDLGVDRLGYGARLDESYAYIAEVISHFDIVAIQELRDPTALRRILDYLGDSYRAEFGFVAPGRAGNYERQGFIYDARKIALGDLSTTIVLDRTEIDHTRSGQPARPPFAAELVMNGRRFFVVTTHIYFGSESGPKFERRIAELEAVAGGIDRAFKSFFPEHAVILAGDLNVSSSDGKEMATLTKNGFQTDPALAALSSNYKNNRPYDQIMTRTANANELTFGKSGIFKVFDYVFRDEEWEDYQIDLRRIAGNRRFQDEDPERFYDRARTFQISDHHLKWAEFRIDWE